MYAIALDGGVTCTVGALGTIRGAQGHRNVRETCGRTLDFRRGLAIEAGGAVRVIAISTCL